MYYWVRLFKLSNCVAWGFLSIQACASNAEPSAGAAADSDNSNTATMTVPSAGSQATTPAQPPKPMAGASGTTGLNTATAGRAGGSSMGMTPASAGSGDVNNSDGDDAGISDAGHTQPPGETEPETTGPKDDGLGAKMPFAPSGMPIMAEERTWTWVPFPEAKCRSGSPAGLSVNLNPSSKRVMIYLEGGGACFDAQTCGSNPDSVGSQNPGNSGVFARERSENPVADWNYVYVPYCTGDVHMGAKVDGQIPGVTGTQQFVGRKNITAFLQRLVPTFSDAEQVVLTGVSAGGFGAASNAAYVQWAFGEVPLTLVDDSGPTFSAEYMPKCLTDLYLNWGLDGSILDDCGSACSASGDYSTQFLDYTLTRAGDRPGGLIESDQDSVIRGFFGIGTNNGANDCMGVLLLTSMAADDFLAGLLEYRERVKKHAKMSTFYPTSTQHTWLGGDSFYTGQAGGVTLVDWIKNVLDGKPAIHAGH
jgi:hypothetical protein